MAIVHNFEILAVLGTKVSSVNTKYVSTLAMVHTAGAVPEVNMCSTYKEFNNVYCHTVAKVEPTSAKLTREKDRRRMHRTMMLIASKFDFTLVVV